MNDVTLMTMVKVERGDVCLETFRLSPLKDRAGFEPKGEFLENPHLAARFF